MFRRIMVPLDGSEFAEQALPHAEQLAALTSGTLHLVRVVEPPSAVRAHGVGAPVNVYTGVISDQQREAIEYLEGVRERLKTRGIEAHVTHLDGYAATVLLDYARDADIDLMVMTRRGRSGLTRWALGAVADRVLQGGTVAVLLVPAAPPSAQEQPSRAGTS